MFTDGCQDGPSAAVYPQSCICIASAEGTAASESAVAEESSGSDEGTTVEA